MLINFIGMVIVILLIPILMIIIKYIRDILEFKKLLEVKLHRKVRFKDIK